MMELRHAGSPRSVVLGFAVALLLLAPALLSVPGAVRDPTVRPSGIQAVGSRVPSSVPIPLTVVLQPANGSVLEQLDAALADPSNGSYRHFLSDSQFLERFAPSAANQSTVRDYLVSHGATQLSATSDGLGLFATVAAGELPSMLGVTLVELPSASPTGLQFAPVGAASWPTAIAPMVAAVGGLDVHASTTLGHLLPTILRDGPRRDPAGPADFVGVTGSPQQLFIGSDFAQGYRVAALFPNGGAGGNGTYGNGTAVATLLMSGYNASLGGNLPPFDPAVVDQYFNDTFNPAWPWPNISGVPVPVDGVVPPPPGPFGPWQDDLLSSTENSLDLEMAGSMAPGARLVNFYFPASVYVSSTAPSYGSLADSFAACLAAALDHNYSGARLVAVTNSYGLPDLDDALWDEELLHAAALGVTVVASSGDQGNAPSNLTGRPEGVAPTWPASVAFATSGVLAVGGTTVTLSGLPTSTVASPSPPELNVTYDTSIGGIASETAWYDTSQGPGSYAGSEGGISTVYAEPSWQRVSAAQPEIVNATLIQGAPSLGRAVPDISLDASDVIAYDYANASGTYYNVVSGTSIAAPLMGGMLAELAAISGHPYGYLDPLLYQMGSYYAAHPNSSGALRDITTGGNYLFKAGPGWDPVTGWGSVRADALARALDDPVIAGYNYTGPTPGLPVLPSPPPHHASPPPPPWAVWLLVVAAAGALTIALYVAVRSESTPVPVPPPGAYGIGRSGPLPPPMRPACPRCGRSLSPWLTVCPWCGTAVIPQS
jgi:subtilase family serine protease